MSADERRDQHQHRREEEQGGQREQDVERALDREPDDRGKLQIGLVEFQRGQIERSDSDRRRSRDERQLSGGARLGDGDRHRRRSHLELLHGATRTGAARVGAITCRRGQPFVQVDDARVWLRALVLERTELRHRRVHLQFSCALSTAAQACAPSMG